MEKKEKKTNGDVLIFGEVLYDSFPEGSVVLGGAPFNVAWHLNSFSQSTYFISSVGNDPLGKDVLDTMKSKEMSTKGVSISDTYPTGKVSVKFENNEPSYTIKPDQAYDHIETPEINISEESILYHGSLALRGDKSFRTLKEMREKAGSVFIDLNIRYPWFNLSLAEEILKDIDWLKINHEEYDILMGKKLKNEDEILEISRIFMLKSGIKNMIITYGNRGARFINNEKEFTVEAYKTDAFVDSVGAGDCFSAVTILGIKNDWAPEAIMKRASKAAALLCVKRGATVDDDAFYTKLLEEW